MRKYNFESDDSVLISNECMDSSELQIHPKIEWLLREIRLKKYISDIRNIVIDDPEFYLNELKKLQETHEPKAV